MTPEPRRDDGEDGEHRPAEIAQVLGETALEPGRERGAAGRVRQHGRRRQDEAGQIVLVEIRRERAAVLAERAEELHPQRIARDRGGHRDPGAGADGDVADPAGYRARPGYGQHHGDDHRGHGRVQQQFLGDEQLGGRQQAKPDAAARRGPPAGAAAPGHQPQRGVDDQRREDRELKIVVARRRLDQRRGEPVDKPGKAGGGGAGVPPARRGEHADRGSGESQRHEHGQAGLRAGQQRQRREEDAGQRHGRVPHQADSLRGVHPGGDQRGQPQVRDGGGVIPEEPGELVGVVRVARHDPRRRVPP